MFLNYQELLGNVRNFSSIPELNGFLIGGASQTPKEFIDIIRNFYK